MGLAKYYCKKWVLSLYYSNFNDFMPVSGDFCPFWGDIGPFFRPDLGGKLGDG
jgi:hypothetical protein